MNQPIQRFALLAVSGLLASMGCGFGIDSAAKIDIDQRLAVMTPSEQSFPATMMVAPKPFVAGQWTQYKLINEKGEPSLITYKVVGEDGGAYWVEIANESYSGKTVIKILLSMPDRANPSTMEIRALKMKDKNGRITEPQGPAIQSARPTYQAAVNMLAVSWQGLPRETVKATAGYFKDSYKGRTAAGWGVWNATSSTWMHPVVPISGLVKSLGIDRATTVDLVGFGEMGATSEIP